MELYCSSKKTGGLGIGSFTSEKQRLAFLNGFGGLGALIHDYGRILYNIHNKESTLNMSSLSLNSNGSVWSRIVNGCVFVSVS
jgi:hypothetical protein